MTSTLTDSISVSCQCRFCLLAKGGCMAIQSPAKRNMRVVLKVLKLQSIHISSTSSYTIPIKRSYLVFKPMTILC